MNPECEASHRFCCGDCIAQGPHKQHDCIVITDLSKSLKEICETIKNSYNSPPI